MLSLTAFDAASFLYFSWHRLDHLANDYRVRSIVISVSTNLFHHLLRQLTILFGVDLSHVGLRVAEDHLGRFQTILTPNLGGRAVPKSVRTPTFDACLIATTVNGTPITGSRIGLSRFAFWLLYSVGSDSVATRDWCLSGLTLGSPSLSFTITGPKAFCLGITDKVSQ